ncbi:MAG: hypothetical protein KIT84_00995 [Labilithrix sp.]|nr:hypothetical protein [Labilithrix sp.]MCW5809561.1 hypothetical protein [Labilithrix sp.]
MRLSPGDKVEEVKGDPIKLKRGEQEPFAGGKAGYRVIRNHDDWNTAWPIGKVPDMPENAVDPKRHMLVFATADSRKVTGLKIKRALETAEFIYVYVTEQKLGENCLQRRQERAYDAVTATRIDKPVKFFITTEPGESCGPPPVASVECRVGGQEKWAPSISAQPGDAVECALTATSRGKFELIDRHLSIGELPAGSSSKFKFKQGSERGTFEVDVYGKYNIKAEAKDEGGRQASGSATVDVKPPKTKDVLVQLVWSGFDIKDVADSFPRVNLRVQEPGARGQRCSADIPVPGLCEVKTRGSYTYMTIPAGARQLPISVQYLEERAEKGPGPCVHVWYDGARTAETCDHGKREAEEIWRAGVLDTSTGKLL